MMAEGIEREEELMQLHMEHGCEAIVGFLVWGLMSRRTKVREQCMAALAALGPNVADRLNELLSTGNLSNTHRRRVEAAMESAVASGASSTDAGIMLLNSILCVIRHKDVELLPTALKLGRYFPRRTLSDVIVTEALNNQSDPRYFGYLLQAIEMLGEHPSPSQVTSLVRLFYSEKGTIRKHCSRLLEKLNSGELDQTLCPGGFQQHHISAEEMGQWPTSYRPINLFPELSDPLWRKGYHYLPELSHSAKR
jgi:hypothetical protein